MRKIILSGLICFTCICFYSCERAVPQSGKLEMINLEDISGIPQGFGDLKAVTTMEDIKGRALLWFEDEERNIRIVQVSYSDFRIFEQVIFIKRY